MKRLPILGLSLAALAAPAFAQEAEGESQGGTGGLVAGDGSQLGNVSVSATPSGHALVLINAEGFPEGIHGVHLHQVGACEGPAFESAGPHIGEADQHGMMVEAGPHPGDLPNAYVGSDGRLMMEGSAIGLTMDMVFDEDGSALVVHAQPDDYETQPGGASGDRIACAVIEPAPGTMADETVDSGEEEPADESQATDEAQQEQETDEAGEDGDAQEEPGEQGAAEGEGSGG